MGDSMKVCVRIWGGVRNFFYFEKVIIIFVECTFTFEETNVGTVS